MSILLAGPGRAFDLGTGKRALWRALAGTPYVPPSNAQATPGDIPGASGWWDAGTSAALLDANGLALPGLPGTVAALADKSGSGRTMTPVFIGGSGVVTAAARVNGLLGGVGRPTGAPGLAPQLDATLAFQVAGLPMGSGSAWTRYVIWTRPNLRAGTSKNGSPVALLTAGSAVILQLDSVAGGRLVLFPGAQQTVLSVTMERRHTHAIILRHSPGAGVDAWLDGTQVATGAPNPLPSSTGTTLTFLHDTTSQGSAQCWLHEAACWEGALLPAQINTLISAGPRWKCGARRGMNVLVIGQSNAVNGLGPANGNSSGTDAWLLTAHGIAWHLGAASYGVIGAVSVTTIGGHAIYYVRQPAKTGAIYLQGDSIHDPGDGSDPSGWALGADGTGVQNYLTTQDPADIADIVAVMWPWSESDSCRDYSEKAYFQDGATRYMALVRAMLGRTASQLPLVWWNAMPFWTVPGMQMHREVMAAMVADPTLNVVCGMPMTADIDPNGTDTNHMASADLIRLGQFAAGPAARAVLASGGGDTVTSIPAGVPSVGPGIVHAYRESATSIIVTVVHDAGTDLMLPGQAPGGVGWAVMDGGSVASPGAIRTATTCARINATHLRVTLASALTSPTSGCSLFYPYGNTWLYRGNAVTDNAASIAKPAGWDIGNDLVGQRWTQNLPLQATTNPITLSDSQT